MSRNSIFHVACFSRCSTATLNYNRAVVCQLTFRQIMKGPTWNDCTWYMDNVISDASILVIRYSVCR